MVFQVLLVSGLDKGGLPTADVWVYDAATASTDAEAYPAIPETRKRVYPRDGRIS